MLNRKEAIEHVHFLWEAVELAQENDAPEPITAALRGKWVETFDLLEENLKRRWKEPSTEQEDRLLLKMREVRASIR